MATRTKYMRHEPGKAVLAPHHDKDMAERLIHKDTLRDHEGIKGKMRKVGSKKVKKAKSGKRSRKYVDGGLNPSFVSKKEAKKSANPNKVSRKRSSKEK